ncbi:LysR family transcriptional regulator [Agrobacterium vitis]|uniref:LysR family transcriptional regulator n=1 Tax=Rhizobium/Agrobacterium group TaxID=227290 RepID=UPI0008DC2B09|nr:MULTISPECIES: LysR family transcriptional regulator [Rhizobium/Agrobacterium group]MCF1432948.1 LysR family transcriptional regulator [Allorhizobium ampelinum]MUO89702.1 LysR family transcriptional regulator [Agrobacterium vitis]MUZ51356.1 LysR family transcriptional regulator [Agrobacterium vitis]MUZ92494.1 LysR family transcriptional regulator [Agrobacterium vitis]MVA38263.1 LysR family transcriptional regulator [Agrobacterium vitis]
MQIKALIYFDELVRTRSMRAAAERLNVQPTAFARQIDQLEHYFGTVLIERSSRGIQLTAAGELLAARAGKTLRELNHVHQLIDDLQGLKRGHVTIHANGATVANLLAPALADFSLVYPNIRFSVTISSAGQAMEALSSAKADMAVTLFSEPDPGIRVRARAQIIYDVIAASHHPAAHLAEMTITELARFPLAVPDGSFGARRAFDAWFSKAGLELDPVFVTGSLEMQRELVLRGAALTLLPAQTVARERRSGELVVIPIAGGAGIRTPIDLCVAGDRQLSFAASKLVDAVERFMREQMGK